MVFYYLFYHDNVVMVHFIFCLVFLSWSLGYVPTSQSMLQLGMSTEQFEIDVEQQASCVNLV
jgi:hypothetical protein